MSKKRYLQVLFWGLIILSTSCIKEEDERLSFTLEFTLSYADSLTLNDTLTLFSRHSDIETNYSSGDNILINSKYFNTSLKVLELGEFGNGVNCREITSALKFITSNGSSSQSTNDDYLYFNHLESYYTLSSKIIPLRKGRYALLLQDTEEVVKVFTGNFNRQLLNKYSIYELNLGDKKEPIDEKVCFIKVD